MAQAPQTSYDKAARVVDEWLGQILPGVSFKQRDALIERLVQALAPPDSPTYREPQDSCAITAAPPADRYCVIAVDAIDRKFYTNPVDAAKAADRIICENIRREALRGGKVAKKVLIVKAVSIVEEAAPAKPLTTVRKPTDEDYSNRLVGAGSTGGH